jgi:hypothetical protein
MYHDETPPFILIVRERLWPGTEDAYEKNEVQLATVCATLKCPHPYLALATVTGTKEVWWLNAFASKEERDGLEASYASNAPLMAAMQPLGKRKEEFRATFSSAMTEYRRDLSADSVLRIAGTRFLVVQTSQDGRTAPGAVFQTTDGTRFVMATANNRADAESIAGRIGPEGVILAVQPQWSFPAESWIDADPEFWHSNAVARGRGH